MDPVHVPTQQDPVNIYWKSEVKRNIWWRKREQPHCWTEAGGEGAATHRTELTKNRNPQFKKKTSPGSRNRMWKIVPTVKFIGPRITSGTNLRHVYEEFSNWVNWDGKTQARWGWCHSVGCGPGPNDKDKDEHQHPSLLPTCGCHVTINFPFMLLWLPYHDRR